MARGSGQRPRPSIYSHMPKAWRDSVKDKCNKVNKIKRLQFCNKLLVDVKRGKIFMQEEYKGSEIESIIKSIKRVIKNFKKKSI